MIERHLRPLVIEALGDTRVVVVLGARQVGKSTLVQQIATTDWPATVLTLDDRATRDAVLDDPTGFVAGLKAPVVIDEVQRAPDLLLAIKARVDRDQTPGQFLLTGSANILTAPRIADALTGRAEYLWLAPFSQGELAGVRESFVPTLFKGSWPNLTSEDVGRAAFAKRVATGGYPAVSGRTAGRRERFFTSYVETITGRDLRTIAQVHDSANVRSLLSALAATSSTLLNVESLARDLAVASNTVRAHLALLETLFLSQRAPAWSSNLLSRVVKAPKAYITDSGLLCHLIGADEQRIAMDGAIAGPIFETFVATELTRQIASQSNAPKQYHYRDRDGREVDIVLERRDGSVVGVEVKSTASASPRDFRGLRHLRDRLGERFKAGVLLYTGPSTVPFGDRLAAVPLAGLWSDGA
ncbi:MAG TPA: ATP-binding protein [Solirubrobacteraceae bacterium]|nr:ATP-binding protein [Solirubrobacteraceae bacterium]